MENSASPAAETTDGEGVAEPRGLGLWRFLPLVVLVSGLVAGYAAGLHEHLSLETVARSRETLIAAAGGSSLLAALAFAVFCLVITAFGFPAPSALAVFGGLLFGWLAGALLAVAGAAGGATVMFLASRSAFGGALRQRTGRMSARLARGFERDAFTYLVALRLAPYIPFIAVNIAPALFRVRLPTFVAATVIGMLPLITIFAWLGEGVDDALASAVAAGRQLTPADLVTPQVKLALSALALLAVLVPLVRQIVRRRSLRSARRRGLAAEPES
jgi:uncharacterized membrane protein YdjX (TVP38/TMEM64 family)